MSNAEFGVAATDAIGESRRLHEKNGFKRKTDWFFVPLFACAGIVRLGIYLCIGEYIV